MEVVVITPCTATRPQELERCIRSVAAQTVGPGLCFHVIVADGHQFHEAVSKVVSKLRSQHVLDLHNHRLLQLPFNTGANLMNGHRIYAALPWLVNAKWVAFLDEDNWYEPDHIEQLLKATSAVPGARWAHSLRKICANDGTLLCNDDCESLGLLKPVWDRPAEHFCDTSTLFLSRQLACSLSPLWDKRLVADRQVSAELVKTHVGATSPHHSLCYTIGEGQGQHTCQVSLAYFTHGNRQAGATNNNNNNSKPALYVFHFDPAKTQQLLQQQQHDPFAEWQMTQFDALRKDFALLDGFALQDSIPAGAHVFVNWVHPGQLPWRTLRRSDIQKHTLLVESPNIRHTCQWDDELFFMFTTVFTFWSAMLEASLPMCRFARMNCHWLGPDHLPGCLRENLVDDGSVAMVLANRPLEGTFVVRDVLLTCQDALRTRYVKDLRNATVYGLGWDRKVDNLGKGVKVGGKLGPAADPRRTVDILQQYTYAMVVENVNADGYVSEKLYDCLVAGCIPLYYGNNNDLVGIPTDMFIDLKQFETSEQLQAYLDTEVDVAAFKQRIRDGRQAVLERAGASYFAGLLKQAMQDASAARQ